MLSSNGVSGAGPAAPYMSSCRRAAHIDVGAGAAAVFERERSSEWEAAAGARVGHEHALWVVANCPAINMFVVEDSFCGPHGHAEFYDRHVGSSRKARNEWKVDVDAPTKRRRG